MMKPLLIAAAVLGLSLGLPVGLQAQTSPSATVEYTYTVTGVAPQQVQDWQPILYVNNVRFALDPATCSGTTGDVLCRVAAPDFTAALTPTGDQRFELALRNGVLNIEGARSAPFTSSRPGAPTMRLVPSPPPAPSP